MKLYLYITNVDDYLEGIHRFRASDEKLEIEGWVIAGTINFKPKVNEQEIRDIALGVIENEEKETRAEFEVKMGLLKEKKANLLSITHQSLEVV